MSEKPTAPPPRITAFLLDLGDTLIDEERWGKAPDPLLPGVRETLPVLARERRLGLLSNSRTTSRVEMAEALQALGIGQHFTVILTSADVGWRKPHPLLFESALALLHSPAAETAMIGNELEADIAGAKAMGLRTIHLRWGKRYRLDPQGEAEVPTVAIGSFREVPEALRRAESTEPPPRTAHYDEESLPWEGLPPK